MGLFSKVFSKETCIACGKEAGSLKRKRLGDDSIVCKDCAKKLSPFFDDFKGSTSSSILSQLESRERNRTLLQGFHVDEAFGEGDTILVDRRQGLFCVAGDLRGKRVESGAQLVDDNPDLIALSTITDVSIEGAGYSGREMKHTVNGQQESYHPRRYEYPCNVRLHLKLDHPYVKAMTADVTSGTIYIQTEGERLRNSDGLQMRSAGQLTADWLLGRSQNIGADAEVWTDNSLEAQVARPFQQAFGNVLDDHPDYAYGFKCSRENWPRIQEYGRCMRAAEAAREALLNAGSTAQPIQTLAAPLFAGMDEAAAQTLVDACQMRVCTFAAGEVVIPGNVTTAEAGFVAAGRVSAGRKTPDGGLVEAKVAEEGHTFAVSEAMLDSPFPFDFQATQDSTVVLFCIDNATATANGANPNYAAMVKNAMDICS